MKKAPYPYWDTLVQGTEKEFYKDKRGEREDLILPELT